MQQINVIEHVALTGIGRNIFYTCDMQQISINKKWEVVKKVHLQKHLFFLKYHFEYNFTEHFLILSTLYLPGVTCSVLEVFCYP